MSDTTTRPQLPAVAPSGDMLANPVLFEHMQRVAKVFCASALIPDHLKKNNGADAFLALQIARERGESPVAVMQNIYFVSGKAGWSAAYMIGRANKSGTFKGPLRWSSEGQGETLKVTCRGKLADTGEEVDATVSMAMAKAEGWTKNSKYATMGEHMLRYRSATMLVRLYCPEVLLGMSTSDELEDLRAAGQLRDVTGEGHATVADNVNAMLAEPVGGQAVSATDAPAVEGEPVASDPPADTSPAKNWAVTAIGQDAIIKGIKDLLSITESEADVQAIMTQNADRMAKMSPMKKDDLERAAETRLGEIKAALPQQAA